MTAKYQIYVYNPNIERLAIDIVNLCKLGYDKGYEIGYAVWKESLDKTEYLGAPSGCYIKRNTKDVEFETDELK